MLKTSINRPLSEKSAENALRIIHLLQTIIICINFVWILDIIIHNNLDTDYIHIIGLETLANTLLANLLYRSTNIYD